METAFEKMVEKVMDGDRLCEACMFKVEGCTGKIVSGNGYPIFPPCAEDIPDEGYIDPRLLKSIYDEMMEETP